MKNNHVRKNCQNIFRNHDVIAFWHTRKYIVYISYIKYIGCRSVKPCKNMENNQKPEDILDTIKNPTTVLRICFNPPWNCFCHLVSELISTQKKEEHSMACLRSSFEKLTLAKPKSQIFRSPQHEGFSD